MKSEIGIVIHAPLERIYALGAEIERWLASNLGYDPDEKGRS